MKCACISVIDRYWREFCSSLLNEPKMNAAMFAHTMESLACRLSQALLQTFF